jgi:phosphate transport system substrate-binding protein
MADGGTLYRITPKAIVQNTNGAVRQMVSGDRNAIGFVSVGLVDDRIKALSIGGVSPMFDNVRDGTYRLSRTFYFVSDGEPDEVALNFVEFMFSEQGRGILVGEGLVPLER